MNNDFDIDWLEGILDMKDFRKLENIILQYSSRNDELLSTLECTKGNDSSNSEKLNSNIDSTKQ